MIVVCQAGVSAQLVARVVRRLVGDREDVVFVDSARKVLEIVEVQRGGDARTVVVSNNNFNGQFAHSDNQGMTADLLAGAVKEIDPNAWFFLYSLKSATSEDFDGIIPKSVGSFDGLHAFIDADPVNARDMGELLRRLPWGAAL